LQEELKTGNNLHDGLESEEWWQDRIVDVHLMQALTAGGIVVPLHY
jgi:hypothetical protein